MGGSAGLNGKMILGLLCAYLLLSCTCKRVDADADSGEDGTDTDVDVEKLSADIRVEENEITCEK